MSIEQERRQQERIVSSKSFSHFRVKIQFYTLKIDGYILNISGHGMGLRLTESLPLEIGQFLSLEIMNLSTKESFRLQATLAWQKQEAVKDRIVYHIGCQFSKEIDLSDDLIAINYSIENDNNL
ncbi:MAG: PilZ domain-containing protein [Leptospiraceae bacterium]|nr:PilZ domain-containing protein [Leptospiraceae bacterium]